MSKLFPLVPFCPDETPTSWATRMAGFHTAGPVVSFLTDLGVSARSLARGHPEAVLKLCELAGVDPKPVLHNNISALGGRRYRLRHLEFSEEFLTGQAMRYCPLCTIEDAEGGRFPSSSIRHRLIWRLAPVRNCGKHRIPLREVGRDDWLALVRQSTPLKCLDEGEREDPVCDMLPSVSPLQTYVEARLEGRVGPVWLDAQDVDQATRATERLGVLKTFGSGQNYRELTQEMWDRAGRSGWKVTAKGEDEIKSFIAHELQKPMADYAGNRPNSSLGSFFDWLSVRPKLKDVGPIRDLVRDTLMDVMPQTLGKKLLGKTVENPRYCTFWSIVRMAGVDRNTLKAILQTEGVILNDTEQRFGGHVIVKYHEAKELVEAVQRAVPDNCLQSAVNGSRQTVQSLVDIGVLKRIPAYERADKRVGKAVDGRSIQDMIRYLRDNSIVAREVPETHLTLEEASVQFGVSERSVLSLLFGGHLKSVYRKKGVDGIRAIRLSPDEISEHLQKNSGNCCR